MECRRVILTGHATRRLSERGIGKNEILETLRSGEIIEDYREDKPYPSVLILGVIDARSLHVVVAVDAEEGLCIVVTVYSPDPSEWEPITGPGDDHEVRHL